MQVSESVVQPAAMISLDRILIGNPFNHLAHDTLGTGLSVSPEVAHGEYSKENLRHLMSDWAGKKISDYVEVLDRTYAHAPDRIAPFAPLLAEVLHGTGHRVALYSGFLPDEVVSAYADAIVPPSAKMDPVYSLIDITYGVATAKDKQHFIGNWFTSTALDVQYALRAQGHTVQVVADGSRSSRPALEKATHPLMINVPKKCSFKGEVRKIKIDWKRSRPAITHVLPRDGQHYEFDFDKPLQGYAFQDLILKAIT